MFQKFTDVYFGAKLPNLEWPE